MLAALYGGRSDISPDARNQPILFSPVLLKQNGRSLLPYSRYGAATGANPGPGSMVPTPVHKSTLSAPKLAHRLRIIGYDLARHLVPALLQQDADSKWNRRY